MGLKSAQTMGDILPLKEVIGHLLLIAPTEYVTGINTTYTKPGDELADAIRCDVAVLTQQDAEGQYGVVYRGCLWFNVVRLSLRKSIPDTINGDAVLARVGQAPAKPGQDPQYTLVDAMADEQAVAFATAWLDAHPEFMAVAMNEARRAAAEGPAGAPPAGQPVPGKNATAGPVPTAPSVAPVPPAGPATAAPAGNVALPGFGGAAGPQAGATVAAAPTPGPAADLIAALSPDEKAKLLAALQNQ